MSSSNGRAALIVAKDRIAASGDYNLSGERYRVVDLKIGSFPLLSALGTYALMNPRKSRHLPNLETEGLRSPSCQWRT